MSFRRKRSGPVPVLGAHLEDLALVGDPLDEKIKAVDEAIKGAAKRVKELRKKLENQATNPALEKQLNDANKKIERIEKERLAAIAKLDGPEQEAKAIAYVNYEKKNADLLKTISKLRDEVAAAAKPDGELQVAAAAKPDDEILADAPQVPTKPVKKTKKKTEPRSKTGGNPDQRAAEFAETRKTNAQEQSSQARSKLVANARATAPAASESAASASATQNRINP